MVKKESINKLEDLFVSAIVITDPLDTSLSTRIKKLSDLMQERYSNYEIIIIDNYLPQKEITKLTDLLDTVACIRVIRLSRQQPKDVCVYIGLETAIGDTVAILSMNDPLDLLPKFVAEAQTADIIFGISTKRIRNGTLNNYGAKLFYWYNKRFLDISIPENSTYYMALSRKAVNALTLSGRYARHIRYLARQIGYNTAEVRYEPEASFQQEKKKLHELLVSALELATNYSNHPLRFLAWLGFGASFLNLLYAAYVIVTTLFNKHVAQGWTTLSLQAAGMFFLLFAILAILCEYIGKILEETRQEASYHILDELNSKVSIADATRRNIVR